jgi:hypothetical protein
MIEYPFRYDGAKVGDEVWVTIKGKDLRPYVVKDVIAEKVDYALMAKERGIFVGKEEDYLIDYWIANHSPGHALTFGGGIYHTKKEALAAIKESEEPPLDFGGPPPRTDYICIGILQFASISSALKASDLFPQVRCVMWAQLDEIGIHLRGVSLDKPELKEAKSEWVRWDVLKSEDWRAEAAISLALDRIADQLRGYQHE